MIDNFDDAVDQEISGVPCRWKSPRVFLSLRVPDQGKPDPLSQPSTMCATKKTEGAEAIWP